MTREDILKFVQESNIDLDELIHDLKSSEAAEINNGGPDSQLDYLLESMDIHELRRALESVG